jgi:hypothetical protein
MTFYHWIGVIFAVLFLALLMAAGAVTFVQRRRVKGPPRDGWLTDELVRQIIDQGRLSSRQVPEADLDMEEIAREEERFWSESWDEPDRYWE